VVFDAYGAAEKRAKQDGRQVRRRPTLESGECSLEESIKKFEEGMALARLCQDRLTQAEQKIEILLKADKNGISTEPFADGEE
jgi:exodeoxyribonuclease VII small subunit